MTSPSYQFPPRPSRDLSGKVAIVTGAGSQGDGLGNGRAISILLAEDGCSVLCVDRDLALAQRTADMVLAEGKGRAAAAAADVTSEKDCERVVRKAVEEFGRLDILVNNVGVLGAKGTAEDVDLVEWARDMEVNVTSMVAMTKYAVPVMKRNDGGAEPGGLGIRGSIVNMGSVAGVQGGTGTLLYPTSKGAVVNMTRAMAAHHAKDGIRVNTVCPGK